MAVKILVIDDVALIRNQVMKLLREAGHDVHGAATGLEGAEAIATHRDFDAVITDDEMPGLTGVELFKRCRATLGEHTPAFVLMSGSNNLRAMKEAKALGFRDVLVKPPDTDRLRATFADIEAGAVRPDAAAD